MNAHELIDTARKLVANDKGLVAMDESNPICHKRFAKLGIPQTEAARRAWRELIVTAAGLGEPEGKGKRERSRSPGGRHALSCSVRQRTDGAAPRA